jgi:hypothetical protein
MLWHIRPFVKFAMSNSINLFHRFMNASAVMFLLVAPLRACCITSLSCRVIVVLSILLCMLSSCRLGFVRQRLGIV